MARNTNNSTATQLLSSSSASANMSMNVPLIHPSSASLPPPRKLKRILPSTETSPNEAAGSMRLTDEGVGLPARRGRRPNGSTHVLSRSAREAARKSNHSRIEKLRREKINDALASLRNLVPVIPPSGGGGDSDERDDSIQGGGDFTLEKDEREKSFKLDILERTVAYIVHLHQKLKEMEVSNRQDDGSQQGNQPGTIVLSRCCNCGGQNDPAPFAVRTKVTVQGPSSPSPTTQCRRATDQNQGMVDHPEGESGGWAVGSPVATSEQPETVPTRVADASSSRKTSIPPSSPSQRTSSTQTTPNLPITLPSISTLLAHTDFVSPISPPLSGRSQPIINPLNIPPKLSLPAAHPLGHPVGDVPSLGPSLDGKWLKGPTARRGSLMGESSDESRRAWSFEEESAASLLVQFSSETLATPEGSLGRRNQHLGHTPSSLFGLLNPLPTPDAVPGQSSGGVRKKARVA